MTTSILIVDDDELARLLLKSFLKDAPYQVDTCNDGLEAWSLLENESEAYSAILLDRRMPNMDGMEVLRRIRAHPEMTQLPVIMQTAADSQEDILDGLQAGASYYLTKPFDKQTLLSIIDVAITDYRHYLSLKQEIIRTENSLNLMCSGTFEFKTLSEGKNIAILLSSVCPDPQSVAMGLSELIINAIEHGNLGITYDEKSTLINSGEWESEIVKRLSSPEYINKFVTIEFNKSDASTEILIKDQGEGFEWEKYLDFDPGRAFDPHGRGIAMANNMKFSKIKYRGKGNEVLVVIPHQPHG